MYKQKITDKKYLEKKLKVDKIGGYYILPKLDYSNKRMSLLDWCKERPISIEDYCLYKELKND